MTDNEIPAFSIPARSVFSSRDTDKWFYSDSQFHHLYPLTVQLLAPRHWTPLSVVRKAAIFLAAENGARVLDIGSGSGKFCLAAAYYRPKAFYYGIEQRKRLVADSEFAKKIIGCKQVAFIHGNFTRLDLSCYNHFYFFNSFYENLDCTNKIDDSIAYSSALYNYYTRYLRKQLEKMPVGTKLATYYSLEDEIPDNFQAVGSDMDDHLKFWVRV